jgi:hypothetical protein
MPYSRLVFRVHAIQRMFQRQTSEEDIHHVLAMGNIIESYPDDTLIQAFWFSISVAQGLFMWSRPTIMRHKKR